MKKNLLIILTILATGLFSNCNYFQNGYNYGVTVKKFMTSLMQKDYAKCVSLMQLGNKTSDKGYMDTIKSGLIYDHNLIAGKFGEKVNFSFLRITKTNTLTTMPVPNTTAILLQCSNDKDLGTIEALMDNKSGKIVSLQPLEVKTPIPGMVGFWMFGLLALCIPVFNIYVLVRVWRSDTAYKWQKSLAIILINVCAIGYTPANGSFFHFLSIQYKLGFSFIKMGYLDSVWIFGIPVAGIYILRQLIAAEKQKRLELKMSKKERKKLQEERLKTKGS